MLTAGAIAWTLGPGGPWLVSQFAEGRAVWRLGSLHLEGVKGNALGDLRVARASLRDEDGVWAEAIDLAVGWEPLRILTREASVRQVSAKTLHIFRQPKLTPAKPPGGSIDVDLNALAIERIVVDEPVFGEAAAFSLSAGLAARGARIDRAMVDLKRLDAASDTLKLDLVRRGEVRLDALLEGPKDGFFAAALKSNEPLRIVAHADGDETTGAGEIDAQIGRKPFVTGDFAWTPDGWRGGGDANLGLAPALADVVARIGSAVRLDGSGARGSRTTFAMTAKTQDAIVNAEGDFGDDWRPAGETRIVADATRLDRLANGLVSGAARFEGALTADKGVHAFTGRLTGTGVRVAGVRANVDGPARLRLTRDLIDVETDLELAEARRSGGCRSARARRKAGAARALWTPERPHHGARGAAAVDRHRCQRRR